MKNILQILSRLILFLIFLVFVVIFSIPIAIIGSGKEKKWKFM